MLNEVQWSELGFVCNDRFLFSQRSRKQTLRPEAFAEFAVKGLVQGNRMNDTVVFSAPFKGEAGRGTGFDDVVCCPSPSLFCPIPTPTLPLKGREHPSCNCPGGWCDSEVGDQESVIL